MLATWKTLAGGSAITSDSHKKHRVPSRNATQLARFAEQGYLVLEDLLPDKAFGPLIAEIEEGIERGARESLEEGRIRQTFDGEPFIRRFAMIEKEAGGTSKAGRHVLGKNLKSAGMFALMTHPVLLDLVESMIGPEILSHPQFNCQAKMPGEEISKHLWHQDLAYLESEAEETPMVNFWIPLVDATKENGCLEVIPASHKTGLKPHGRLSAVWKRFIADEHLPPGRVVACPTRRGGAIVFHPKLVHRSRPNRSQGIRWSVDIRYSDPEMPSGREEVPGFLARSMKRCAEVATSHLDWLKLMEG